MSKTLNLSECLLAMGRELQDQGRTREAAKLFTRLVNFRDLDAHMAEDVRARLADLLLSDRQFKAARRHLSVLMCSRPGNAKYFYQFALALHRDPQGDPHRAVDYYTKALDLDPAQPKRWSAYGKLLTDIGNMPEAVAALQQAYELDADNPVIVGRYVEALALDEQLDVAHSVLRAARFAHPRDGRFRKLWNDFQHRRAAEQQRRPAFDEPVLLPFVRRAALTGSRGPATILRFDDARPLAAPHRQSRAVRHEP